ncbi:ISL3 family transposase [Streptomyces sp. 7N604]|uniref:ISL3 family transposase n=1 Tax=Streptomyces sp. 7N604 TaxID=3457415 RepID=UPI003FD66A2D
MQDVNELVDMVFSGLLPLVIEDVVDEGERILVRARTPHGTAACPGCGAQSGHVHGYHERTVADVPVDGRRVVVRVRMRRLVCPTRGCRHTFREQVPGVLERYQRRTARLTGHVTSVVKELAGRAGSRLLSAWAVRLSRHTALRVLRCIPLPRPRVPRVLGVDDFALRRRHRYATVLIDAETHERIDVLPDRKAETLQAWLRDHPGVEIVCRDGSVSYAEAVRRALPEATQVSDRWHVWHGLARAVEKTVVAHSGCWAKAAPKRRELTRERTTLARWHAVHDLLGKGVGLLDCARRLGLTLNTVKRYARTPEPDRLRRPPRYRACQVDPYRDHLRRRRAEDPGVPVKRLLEEIHALGYTGSLNLLYKYVNQGRLEGDCIVPSPRRLTSWIMTRPEDLPDKRRVHLDELVAACPEMTALAGLVRAFAQLTAERRGSDLDSWAKEVRQAGLPEIGPFLNGLAQDHDAAVAGLSLPYSNGPAEGINTKTKLIKRQMYGRAGFPLLRHRILLA